MGSSVSIVTRLWAGRPRNCNSIPGGVRAFTLLLYPHCSAPTHPPHQWISEALSSGAKLLCLKPSTHLHLLRWLRMGGSVPPLPLIPYSFMACVGTNLRLLTLSDHAHVCVCVCMGKSILLAHLYGGCDSFVVGVVTEGE